MDKEEIINNIRTYLIYNHTEELKVIPFSNIFGSEYKTNLDYSEIKEIIQSSVSNVTIDGTTYYIGCWNCTDGLFYLKVETKTK